jgi:hypothetical protein
MPDDSSMYNSFAYAKSTKPSRVHPTIYDSSFSTHREKSQDSCTDSELVDEPHFHERQDKRLRIEPQLGEHLDGGDRRTRKGESGPHVCGMCSRSYTRHEHLSRHELSHTKAKSFPCTECNLVFARRDLLLRHQQKLHMIRSENSDTRSSSRENITGCDNERGSFTRGYAQMLDTVESIWGRAQRTSQPRGRTPERAERSPYSQSSPDSSRASSSSSVRTMIDERLEWAHQDRVRAVGRNNPVQQSPFHRHSPFYSEFANEKSLAPVSHGMFVCECCPKKPKKFDTEDDLRYAIDATSLQSVSNIMADGVQVPRIDEAVLLRLLSRSVQNQK